MHTGSYLLQQSVCTPYLTAHCNKGTKNQDPSIQYINFYWDIINFLHNRRTLGYRNF